MTVSSSDCSFFWIVDIGPGVYRLGVVDSSTMVFRKGDERVDKSTTPTRIRRMNAPQAYEELIKTLKEISLLGSMGSVLGWDERTQRPSAGAPHRAEQLSMLARMVHERFTSPRIGEL